MRKLDTNNEIKEVFCNQCGKTLKVENGIIKEGSFRGDVSWGYFSSQDGVRHTFDLCEACYLQMIQAFRIPVTKEEETELL